MKNIIRAVLIALVSVWIFPPAVFGQVEWEAEITVSSAYVESRLAIGQRNDADDQQDGRYDVPPMLAGSLRAWMLGSGTGLWRDIRASGSTGEKDWQLVVDNRSGEQVVISWSPPAFPAGAEMVLIDQASGKTVNMKKQSSYGLTDPAGGEVLMRLTY